jgi:hypothetical protein
MPQMGFESASLVFELAKTFNVLHRASTMIDLEELDRRKNNFMAVFYRNRRKEEITSEYQSFKWMFKLRTYSSLIVLSE